MTIDTNIHLQIFTLVKECCKEGDDQGEKFCFKKYGLQHYRKIWVLA